MAKIEMRAVPNHPLADAPLPQAVAAVAAAEEDEAGQASQGTVSVVGNGHRAHVPPTSIDFGLGLGSIDSVRQEIRDVFEDMKEFYQKEPDDVMRLCSGHSARMSEIRVLIQQVEVVHRQWKPVRANEVEHVIKELKSQFDIASRIVAVRELDFKMAGGQP